MSNTLVDRLKEIERIPDYIKVDKAALSIELLEEQRKKNKLVDLSIRGDIKIPEYFDERVYREFGGVRTIIPTYMAKGEKEELGELKEIIGNLPFDNIVNLMINPISSGAVAVGLCAADRTIDDRLLFYDMDRRGFFKLVKSLMLTGSISFGTIGVIGSPIRSDALGDLRKNAIYFQEKIDWYRNLLSSK